MGTAAGFLEYETMPSLSSHAGSRMGSRRISGEDVANVMSYGRTYYARGAVIYALGRHEADTCRKDGEICEINCVNCCSRFTTPTHITTHLSISTRIKH